MFHSMLPRAHVHTTVDVEGQVGERSGCWLDVEETAVQQAHHLHRCRLVAHRGGGPPRARPVTRSVAREHRKLMSQIVASQCAVTALSAYYPCKMPCNNSQDKS